MVLSLEVEVVPKRAVLGMKLPPSRKPRDGTEYFYSLSLP